MPSFPFVKTEGIYKRGWSIAKRGNYSKPTLREATGFPLGEMGLFGFDRVKYLRGQRYLPLPD